MVRIYSGDLPAIKCEVCHALIDHLHSKVAQMREEAPYGKVSAVSQCFYCSHRYNIFTTVAAVEVDANFGRFEKRVLTSALTCFLTQQLQLL